MFFEFGDNCFEAFFEIAAIARSGQKRAHVQREDRGVGQNLWGFVVDDAVGEALGDGGFANTRITNQQRVVLTTAAQHLNAALDLMVATDQRINVALAGFCVQIDAVLLERAFFLVGLGFMRSLQTLVVVLFV